MSNTNMNPTNMIEEIRTALDVCGIADWCITEQRRESAQLFFIKKHLDMRRFEDTVTWNVTVYREAEKDGKHYIGSAGTIIAPGVSQEELHKKLTDAYGAAANTLNPAYPLYEGPRVERCKVDPETANLTLQEGARQMAKALLETEPKDGAFLNSAEIFSERMSKRILASTGTDVSFSDAHFKGEYIVQCREPMDVEQYFSFDFTKPEEKILSEQVNKAFRAVADRAHADKMPPAGTYDLLIGGEQLKRLMKLYLVRSSAAMAYAHYSDWSAGTCVQTGETTGERLKLSVLPTEPYSSEGIPMKERLLIENGQLNFLHGDARFASYLGIEPTGTYTRVRLDNGSVPFEKLKKGCLYPVSFSDFRMDPMSGRFGGEIRLAYLFTEQGTEIFTGGSVNGSLLELQKDMVFTTERYGDALYEGPLAVRLRGVAVNGRTE